VHELTGIRAPKVARGRRVRRGMTWPGSPASTSPPALSRRQALLDSAGQQE
jgi:hypothetical protein